MQKRMIFQNQELNYLGSCFLKIATHLSYKPNFVNYMFRDDMISDGIENCVQYIHNFDPEKSRNPFAYFTQIIHYAFLRRIQKEKKQLDIKTKIIERTGFDEVMNVDDGALTGSSSEYNTIISYFHDLTSLSNISRITFVRVDGKYISFLWVWLV